jgi:Fe-S cluster biogenesis protein NfuA
MFINVENTPNPNTLQFVLSKNIIEDNKTYNFNNTNSSTISPLVNQLFTVAEITGVLLSSNFISVSIKNSSEWDVLKPLIISHITEFLSTGFPIVIASDNAVVDEFIVKNPADKEIALKIQELFDERIRPAVAMDGGDIILKEYAEGKVYIAMQGSCSGCPSSTITLKNGIENMLKYYIPEIVEVIDIDTQI